MAPKLASQPRAKAAAVTLFCTGCGRPAVKYADTLDPDYPLVSCSHFTSEGEDKGCGVKPGSADWHAVQGIVSARRVKKVTANHHWHVSRKRPNPLCEQCRVDPPLAEVVPHPFEEFSTKWRTASHLELVHHNRAMLSRLPYRTAGELEKHHRGLHA